MNHSVIDIIALFFCSSLLIAVLSVVYAYILIQPGEIFAGTFRFLNELFQTDERESRGEYPHPIFKMIMRCEKCVSGQIAFWSYLVIMFPAYCRFRIFIVALCHLCFIALTIFLTLCIKKLYQKHIE